MTSLVLNDAISSYTASLRAVGRAIWKGLVDYYQAYDAMDAAIRVGIPRAWKEGLAEAGFTPDEMSDEERVELNRLVILETQHIHSFITFCQDNAEAKGGKQGSIFARINLWVKRAQEAMNRAKMMAKNNPKLIWELGATEKHCPSCLKLTGKVKRAKFWVEKRIQPQNAPNPYLECEGWLCDCRLSVTDEPLSKGPLPSLP